MVWVKVIVSPAAAVLMAVVSCELLATLKLVALAGIAIPAATNVPNANREVDVNKPLRSRANLQCEPEIRNALISHLKKNGLQLARVNDPARLSSDFAVTDVTIIRFEEIDPEGFEYN
jgi:hypothetical protein